MAGRAERQLVRQSGGGERQNWSGSGGRCGDPINPRSTCWVAVQVLEHGFKLSVQPRTSALGAYPLRGMRLPKSRSRSAYPNSPTASPGAETIWNAGAAGYRWPATSSCIHVAGSPYKLLRIPGLGNADRRLAAVIRHVRGRVKATIGAGRRLPTSILSLVQRFRGTTRITRPHRSYRSRYG